MGSSAVGCGGGEEATDPEGAQTLSEEELLGEPGPPTEVDLPTAPELEAGRQVFAEAGCLGCHQIGAAGAAGLGGDLTTVGADLSRAQIERAVIRGPGSMPSYDALPRRYREQLVDYLASLE